MAYSVTSRTTGVPYYLHSKEVTLPGGRRQTIYFFSRLEHEGALDDLPTGLRVFENSRTGLPMLRKDIRDQEETGFVVAGPLEEIALPPTSEVHLPSRDRQLVLPQDVRSQLSTIEVIDISEELIRSLTEEPDLLYDITPRRFEELIAKLLQGEGYEVEITAASRDGGRDILARRTDKLGEFLTLVECKRLGRRNPVSVSVARELYGVLSLEKASHAMIATTSHFTREAWNFQRKVPYQLSFRDYDCLRRWLVKHKDRRR